MPRPKHAAPRDAAAMTLEGADGTAPQQPPHPGGAGAVPLAWSDDAVGTWILLMDGEQPLPLCVYGPDRRADRDRVVAAIERAR